MQTKLLTVSAESWIEHSQARVAAINDPMFANTSGQARGQRQSAIAELIGVRPGDRLFFYVTRTKEVMGGFESTGKAFFDQSPLIPNAQVITAQFPFRVGFKTTVEYSRPIKMKEIWAWRDAGEIWTLQQARGDVVGRHSCRSLTRREGDLLEGMLLEINITAVPASQRIQSTATGAQLPMNLSVEGVQYPHMHYEGALQALIVDGLADGNWKSIFGDYDDVLPYVPTSEGTEIDLLLIKYDARGEVIWYQILELKSDRYKEEHLLQLLSYEAWLTSNQAGGNPRKVHMAALANRFDKAVLTQARARSRLEQKPVRLIEYDFDEATKSISLRELTLKDLETELQ